ncbi:MAG TPA: CHAD domain-containing protein [Thermoanaerobaculia bacterium]|jgi:CHAD domain-containing protein|nr:CHAD domain-containing protein [Thermoanaerobaculia bacterium]
MEPLRPLRERPPEEGARLLALHHLDQAADAFPRLQDPADTEALHDFRVALRRLRSCLRSYGPWLDKSLPRKLRRRLKKLAAATGPGRDTEVQIEWLRGRSRHLGSHHRAGLAWLLARLEERMREANEDMADHIPDEFPRLEEALRKRLSTYTTEVHLDAASRPTLAEAAAAILRDQASELRSNLSHVEDPADEEQAHEARISAKRLRYLLEPFAEELPEAASVVKHMKGLQETLGELHDAHVLEHELAGSLDVAAVERARRLLEINLSGVPDDALLRAERRRVRESGVLALAKLNRVRRDRLFDDLETDWLDGQGEAFFEEVEALASRLEGSLSPGIGDGERGDGIN